MANQPQLDGRTVAILATNGFEQSELVSPLETLREAGATVHVVAPESGTIRAWDHAKEDWGRDVEVDRTLSEAKAADYDALVLPGGVMNPDALRVRQDATTFVRDFFKDGKPVSAICHGPQLLIDCGVLEGRELTSHPAIKLDLKNAGARWTDQAVVADQGLVTSRTPDDLPEFLSRTIEEIVEGRHPAQATA